MRVARTSRGTWIEGKIAPEGTELARQLLGRAAGGGFEGLAHTASHPHLETVVHDDELWPKPLQCFVEGFVAPETHPGILFQRGSCAGLQQKSEIRIQ